MAAFSGSELQSVLLRAEAAHEIGQRTGDQEIFLHETQSLPQAGRVVGIQHAGQRLGRQRLGESAHEIAVLKSWKSK